MDHQWTAPCPAPDALSPDDQAVFQRVWQRVMAGREESAAASSPDTTQTLSQTALEAPPETALVPAQGPAQPPAPGSRDRSAAPAPQHRGDDFPAAEDVPCLGPASAVHSDMLQQAVLEELTSWQLFRHLARRAGSPGGRVLAAIASDDHRHARRLSTACFLITGARYWPVDQLSPPALGNYLGTLRRQFAAKQRHSLDYQAQAGGTGDRCLAQLLRELSQEEALHAQMLRGVLEQSGF